MIERNVNRYFFGRQLKCFLGEKFNRDLTFADWRTMYQKENCDEKIFQSILDQHAPTQIGSSSIKQNKKVIKHGDPRNSKNQ